jgi:hypothetical protein
VERWRRRPHRAPRCIAHRAPRHIARCIARRAPRLAPRRIAPPRCLPRRPLPGHIAARHLPHVDPCQVMSRGPTSLLSRRPSPGHGAGVIQICVFARVGRRPCGNFDFLACHVSHVNPLQVTSRDFPAKLWTTCLQSSSRRRRPFSGRKRP